MILFPWVALQVSLRVGMSSLGQDTDGGFSCSALEEQSPGVKRQAGCHKCSTQKNQKAKKK